MYFYVIAKCIDSEKGDVIIDFKEKTMKFYKALYQLKEDQEYEVKDNAPSAVNYLNWDTLKSYDLAFGKGQGINRNGFRFISIKEKDHIRIDNNNLLYINDLFSGKFVNQKEVEILQKEGIEKFKSKLDISKKEGVRLLVKGKKIYRTFTKSKHINIKNNSLYQHNLLEIIDLEQSNDVNQQIEIIEADLKKAMTLILNALNTLDQIKNSKK